MMESLGHLDLSLLLWINRLARRHEIFDRFVEAWLDLNFLQGGFFFIFIWWMWFRLSSDPKADRVDAVRILIAVWSTVVIARALQIGLPARTRPLNDLTIDFVLPYGGQRGAAEHYSSFPSDHAVVYFALATAIWARYRWLGAVCCVWTFLFACLSRVYAGFHYPGDVLAGALIGIAYMYAIDRIALPPWAYRLVERLFVWEHRHPASFYCAAVAVTFECMVLFEDVRIVGRFLFKISGKLLA